MWTHFYPRSPRGERRIPVIFGAISSEFLSTLPARGATACGVWVPFTHPFLSTLPARGATPIVQQLQSFFQFLSTLPARGATLPAAYHSGPGIHFYPRSPRGERPKSSLPFFTAILFLSTLPARGATPTTPIKVGGQAVLGRQIPTTTPWLTKRHG